MSTGRTTNSQALAVMAPDGREAKLHDAPVASCQLSPRREISSWRMAVVLAGSAFLGFSVSGCGSIDATGKLDPTYGVEVSPRVVGEGEEVPKGGGSYKVGKPYKVAGKTYYPAENTHYVAEGTASWYGRDFHGRKTANGEIFDMESISLAHRTLPMPSYVRVTNLANNRSIIARVNNRGPYVSGRVVDVSYRTAQLLGFASRGVTRVRVEYVGRAPLSGSDDRMLAMTLSEDGTPAQLKGSASVMVASAKPFVPQEPEVGPTRMAEAPLPTSRPYDLNASPEASGVQVATAEPSSAASEPARAPEPDTSSRSMSPSAVAATVPAPKTTDVAAVGWSSGPAPVSGLGFAGVAGQN